MHVKGDKPYLVQQRDQKEVAQNRVMEFQFLIQEHGCKDFNCGYIYQDGFNVYFFLWVYIYIYIYNPYSFSLIAFPILFPNLLGKPYTPCNEGHKQHTILVHECRSPGVCSLVQFQYMYVCIKSQVCPQCVFQNKVMVIEPNSCLRFYFFIQDIY